MNEQQIINLIMEKSQKYAAAQGHPEWGDIFGRVNVAIAYGESSLNPNSVNNTSDSSQASYRAPGAGAQPEYSVGLFQNNKLGGRGTGYTEAQLRDPALNTDISLPTLWGQFREQSKPWGSPDKAFAQDPGGFTASVHKYGQGSVWPNRQTQILPGLAKTEGTPVTTEATPEPSGKSPGQNLKDDLFSLFTNAKGMVVGGVLKDKLGNIWDADGNVMNTAGHVYDAAGSLLGKIDRDAWLRAAEGAAGGFVLGLPAGLPGAALSAVAGGAAAGVGGSSDTGSLGGLLENVGLGALGAAGFRVLSAGARVAAKGLFGKAAKTAAPAAAAAATTAAAGGGGNKQGGGGNNQGGPGGRMSVNSQGGMYYYGDNLNPLTALMIMLPGIFGNLMQAGMGIAGLNETQVHNRMTEEISQAATEGGLANDKLKAELEGFATALTNNTMNLHYQTTEAIQRGQLINTVGKDYSDSAIDLIGKLFNYNETNLTNRINQSQAQARDMGTIANNLATNQRELQKLEIDKVEKALKVAEFVRDSRRWNAQNLMPASMKYLPGFEPNGLWAQAGKTLGLGFQPVELAKVNRADFDPTAMFNGALATMPKAQSEDATGIAGLRTSLQAAQNVNIPAPKPVDFSEVKDEAGLTQRGQDRENAYSIRVPERQMVATNAVDQMPGMGNVDAALANARGINVPQAKPLTWADTGLDKLPDAGKAIAGTAIDIGKLGVDRVDDAYEAIKRAFAGG